MHIGQWLMTETGAGKIKVFSPWFPRGGDNAIFTYEKIFLIGGQTFTVKVVHKIIDTAGDGAVATAASGWNWTNASGTSLWTARYDKLKELVRFQFELEATDDVARILYRMLNPTWFNDAQ